MKTARKTRVSNNVTLSLDEDLLKSGREYAEHHGTSLNSLIRNLLAQTVQSTSSAWITECFKVMDQTKTKSKGRNWKRSDIYDV